MSPPDSSGVSRCVIRVLSRSRCDASPLTSTLLVRSSATILTVGMPPPSAAALVYSVLTMRTTSEALACCIGITSMFSSPVWSMRWMMRIMRFTFDARSEMISMFEAGYAARCPYWGISGRRIGTSWAALTFLTATTCVTISSDESLTRDGRSLAGTCRALASGMILITSPEGTATKPCTCRIDRKAS